ncbi:MAG: zinc transport system permease protein [Thermoplasmata archaeon]|jgi:zinc transport system permease protein|nr:zinc transport system permease protein [Thermoplasmata archaeon]
MSFDLFLTQPYFQRILATALLVAVTAAVLGVFLVLRNLSLFGDGIAHISFAGVALGFVLGILPVGMALLSSLLGALAIQELRRRGITKGDTAIGIIFTGSLAFGVLLLSFGTGTNLNLESYLFGNLLLVGATDFYVVAATAAVVLLALLLLYRPFFSLTFDAQAAEVQGLPVRALETVFTLLTAAAIVIAARIVGVLLVSSLLVVPAATALQWARGFRQALALAVVLALASVLLGLFLSAEIAVPSGAAIAVVSTALFAGGTLLQRVVRGA